MSYALTGDYWGKSTLTYYISPLLKYFDEIFLAFETWDYFIDIEFDYTTSLASADIAVFSSFIDGPFGIVGETHWSTWGSGPYITKADIFLDANDAREGWLGSEGTFIVALHEIGHAIGLDHPDDPSVVMSAYIDETLSYLQPDDIAGAQALYGVEVAPNGWAYVFTPGWEQTYTQENAFNTQYGWNISWYYGWYATTHYAWYYEYSWGWQFGWGWSYAPQKGSWGWVLDYGWHIAQQSEIVGYYSWVSYSFGWSVGWNVSWHEGWGWGWTLGWTWGGSWGWVPA